VKLDKNQQKIAIVAGGAIILYLIWRWYQGQQQNATAATGQSVPATDTAASDYASLAGQEQGDVATLQTQLSGLTGQEQSDVAALQGDISGLTGNIDTLGQFIQGLGTLTQTQSSEIAGIATGQQTINRRLTATVQPKRGGGFYQYYVKVTGHAPPATVSTSNFIYEAWKAGVKAARLAPSSSSATGRGGHHHAGAHNNHVSHPNSTHNQQSNTHHRYKNGSGSGKQSPHGTTKKSGVHR
jgi:hypothetical protein